MFDNIYRNAKALDMQIRLKGSSVLSPIKLSDAREVPNDVQVLRVGSFNHPTYGAFDITTETLSEMKSNFDAKIRGVDLAFDYYHNSDQEAAAWINSLELREDGSELWANVTWTPKASQKLSDREIRYFSPDFAFKWTDPENGVTFSNVLFGGGLTNRPFVKEMKAIVANETIGENDMTELEKLQLKLKEETAKSVKLAEDNAALTKKCDDIQAALPPAKPAAPAAPAAGDADKDKQIADLKAQLAKLQQDNEMAMGEIKKAKDAAALSDAAKQMAEKTSAFNVLLTEGKACAAQKDAYLKGDMTEFIKLAQPVNLKGSGSSENKTLEESDTEAIFKLADEKQKANPKMDRGQAVSAAKKELKK